MIKIYYSSSSDIGKQVVSYANASFKDILAIDITKSNVTGTQWKELADQLDLSIGDLVNKEHPSYTNHYDTTIELDEDGWIKILDNTPEVLHYPIVIIANCYYMIKNPSDIEKLLEPNSKGIDEKNYI